MEFLHVHLDLNYPGTGEILITIKGDMTLALIWRLLFRFLTSHVCQIRRARTWCHLKFYEWQLSKIGRLVKKGEKKIVFDL